MIQRFLQNSNRGWKPLRHGSSFRHHQTGTVILHLNQIVAAVIIIHRKLLRIGKLHTALRPHVLPDRSRSLLLSYFCFLTHSRLLPWLRLPTAGRNFHSKKHCKHSGQGPAVQAHIPTFPHICPHSVTVRTLFNLLSHSVLILAESNSSVYSISWGVLIAVVSAATAIFRSNTVTGISNTEVSPP